MTVVKTHVPCEPQIDRSKGSESVERLDVDALADRCVSRLTVESVPLGLCPDGFLRTGDGWHGKWRPHSLALSHQDT